MQFFGLTGNRPQSAPACSFLRYRAFKKTAMQQTIYILTLTLLLLSCSGKTRKTVDTKSVDTLRTISAGKMQSGIYIKDKSQYDQTFIDGLSEYNEPIKLIDNFMLIGNDTTYFPDDLNLNKEYIFKANNASQNYVLTVKRINETTLKFNFQLFENSKLLQTETGEANLPSLFFLGPEGEPDIQTGDSFFSQEYLKKDKSIWLCINIGMDKDYKGKQRAKITYRYMDKSKQTSNLEECPILRLE
jgi:hypothetical protein